MKNSGNILGDLAEGEVPEGMATTVVGVEARGEEAEGDDGDDGDLRQTYWRFDCARRTGTKFQDSPDDPILIEVAA